MSADGSKNGKSPDDLGIDAPSQSEGLRPELVARRISGADAERGPGGESSSSEISDITRAERKALVEAQALPALKYLDTIDAQGTEHAVCFRGSVVEKHQRKDGWMPTITKDRLLGITYASPSQYLRRLELQNQLFGDGILVIGTTRGNRFAITQPSLKGGEPSEMDIKETLQYAGWKLIPIHVQDLPPVLMGSAWWHDAENAVLIDARKPNFKKIATGEILPIDLILADLTTEMRDLVECLR